MARTPQLQTRDIPKLALTACLAAGAGAFIYHYPLSRVWLGLVLAGVFCIVWRWPDRLLTLLLLVLPAASLAEFSGWEVVNEFDVIVAVGAAAYLWRRSGAPAGDPVTRPIIVLSLAFAASAVVSVLSVWPEGAADGPIYTSPWNAARMLRPFVWFWLLYPAIRDAVRAPETGARAVTDGMVGGLAIVACVAIWERLLFLSFDNFTSNFRVISTFSSMHVGGSHVEAYLVAALPFAGFFAISGGRIAKTVALAVLVMGVYALAATFSRAGVGALAVGLAVGVVCLLVANARRHGILRRVLAVGSAAVVCMALAAWPVLDGKLLEHRLQQAEADFASRFAHWQESIGLMDSTWKSRLLGEGLGTYPALTQLSIGPPGTLPGFSLRNDGDNVYLALDGGELDSDRRNATSARFPVVFQAVELADDDVSASLLLQADARVKRAVGDLTVSVCQGGALYFRRCHHAEISLSKCESPYGINRMVPCWQPLTRRLDIRHLADRRLGLDRPLRFGLSVRQPSVTVELDNIRIVDGAGNNLIDNGDFSKGRTYWYYHSHAHQLWHVDNLWVHVLFETGWVGLAALLYLMYAGAMNLLRGIGAGSPFAITLAVSLVSIMSVGLLGTVIDLPRLGFLLLVLVALTGIFAAKPAADEMTDGIAHGKAAA